MMWTLDGTAVMRGDRVVKQCATVEDAEAYLAELADTVVQVAAGKKPKAKVKMGKNGKPLPPWLQPKGADDDDADDTPAKKK